MKKNTIWRVAGLGVLATLVILGTFAITDRVYTDPEQRTDDARTITVAVTIEDLFARRDVEVTTPATVLEVLQQLHEQDESMQLVTKEYSGLGILVESIGDHMNGANGEYWQYTVNGIMPQIGADKLEIHSGDHIEWSFEKSEF